MVVEAVNFNGTFTRMISYKGKVVSFDLILVGSLKPKFLPQEAFEVLEVRLRKIIGKNFKNHKHQKQLSGHF